MARTDDRRRAVRAKVVRDGFDCRRMVRRWLWLLMAFVVVLGWAPSAAARSTAASSAGAGTMPVAVAGAAASWVEWTPAASWQLWAPAASWLAWAPPASWQWSWQWPLSGSPVVSRPHDPPAQRYGVGHRGVDLAGSPGQPVLAAGAGRIAYAGLLAGRGVVVVVHGELRTTYEPVGALVTVGQAVDQGEVIGLLEPRHLGCPAAACLHWGLKRGEDYLDPLLLLERGPARLLPPDGPPPVRSLLGAADTPTPG